MMVFHVCLCISDHGIIKVNIMSAKNTGKQSTKKKTKAPIKTYNIGGKSCWQPSYQFDKRFAEWVGHCSSDKTKFACKPCGVTLSFQKMGEASLLRHAET